MLARLFSKRDKNNRALLEEDWSDEEDFEQTLGARSGRSNDAGNDWQQGNYGSRTNWHLHIHDPDVFVGYQAPDMADVLGLPRPAPHRRRRRRRSSLDNGGRTMSASRRRRASAAQPPMRRPPVDGRVAGSPWELDDPFLRELDEIEAPHGPYDTVGDFQLGADMFRPGTPPAIFMPHLAAHAEYQHHLALPYNMSHVHPSMYEGAPLIRGFPEHDRILGLMQQTSRENYRRQDPNAEHGW
jgi:hypothetical protein